MSDVRYVLGIDTSNYKTSLAITQGKNIICDLRKFLVVREGEKGLRQSEAFFQHVKNLPEMFKELKKEFSGTIDAVACSSRPRPIKDSYMPCFLAGEAQGETIASILNIPIMKFSHQEGHIEAVRMSIAGEGVPIGNSFIACHFSGGTCEILKVSAKPNGYKIGIMGGTKDISFGQVLDRVGVSMGMNFPCGEALDNIVTKTAKASKVLTPIKVDDCKINLSGFESQIQRHLQMFTDVNDGTADILIKEIFEKMSDAVVKMIIQTAEKSGEHNVIMSGGVSSSRFIREKVTNSLKYEGINVYFDRNNLSSDNAVGTALLGSRCIWD